MKKYFIKTILILSMLLTLIPMTVNAAKSGACGDDLTWSLDDNGTLTISGMGEMNFSTAPWYNDRKLIKSVKIEDGVTNIGTDAFVFSSNLTDVTLANSIKTIGSYAFASCSSLEQIRLPDSVTGIYDNAFYGCFNLSNVIFPKNLTSIGLMAFADCTKLKEINLPSKLTKIDEKAFGNCTELTTISIPKTLSSVGKQAFYGCSKIKQVYYSGAPEEWSAIRFSSGNDSLTNATIQFIPAVYFYIGSNGNFIVTPTNIPNGNTIVCACYNDNKMVSVTSSVYAGESTMPFSTTEAYDKVKIMAWESLETFAPLCEVQEITVAN